MQRNPTFSGVPHSFEPPFISAYYDHNLHPPSLHIKTSAHSEQALGDMPRGKKKFHLPEIQVSQEKATQASHLNESSRVLKPSLWMNYNDGDDHSHNDNTIISVPLSSCGKGKQAVRLQKLHYGSVRPLIFWATAEKEKFFHWPVVTIALVSCCDWPLSHSSVCVTALTGLPLFSSQSFWLLFQASCFVSGITDL